MHDQDFPKMWSKLEFGECMFVLLFSRDQCKINVKYFVVRLIYNYKKEDRNESDWSHINTTPCRNTNASGNEPCM